MSNVSTLPVTTHPATTPLSGPRLRAVPPPTAEPADPAEAAGPDWAQLLPQQLPEGATVLAAFPQTALPQQLLEQYSGGAGRQAGTPVVGYLVLVSGQSLPPTPAPPPATAQSGSAGQLPGIVVDAEQRTALVDGELLDLTYLEFELLAHLTAHPNRVHSRDHLVSAVWGYGHVGDGRTVDVHVARLRRKLGPVHRESIVTVRRVGYKYVPAARG